MTILKDKMFIVSILLLSFFCFVSPLNVKAEEDNIFESERLFAESTGDGTCQSTTLCDNVLGDPEKAIILVLSCDPDCTAYWLQWILDIIKYIAIAALLVLSTFDFIKAIISNDKDALKKAGTTAAKRFIFVVILFFLPIIIDLLMRLFGAYGTCGIE